MPLFASFVRLHFVRRGAAPARQAWRATLCALAVFLAGAAHVRAQPAAPAEAQPFSTLSLYAGPSAPIRADRLGAFYRSSPGFDVAASMPFYAGVVGFDVGLQRYEGRLGRANEDFWAAPITLRWGVHPALGRLRVEGDVHLGALLMQFSGGGPGLRSESELLMGADAGLSLRLTHRLRVVAGVRYERIFTSIPFTRWRGRAGLRYRFDTPGWLQAVLR